VVPGAWCLVQVAKFQRSVVMSISFKPNDDREKAEIEDKVVLTDDDSM